MCNEDKDECMKTDTAVFYVSITRKLALGLGHEGNLPKLAHMAYSPQMFVSQMDANASTLGKDYLCPNNSCSHANYTATTFGKSEVAYFQ